MLDQYLQRTQLLLGDPEFVKFNEGDLTNYVNMARGQLAGETECIRVYATLAVDNTAQQYPFSSVNLGGLTTSVLGVLNVRQITYAVASGQAALHSRPFPWFNQYVLAQSVPTAGVPESWSQFGQGATGSIFINLLDGPYTLSLDCVGYPVALDDDSTAEAIPYQFTDAVPFFAAYFAALTANDMDRADALFKEYSKFAARGRQATTSSVLPTNFSQAPDPFMANRLGLQQKGQQ